MNGGRTGVLRQHHPLGASTGNGDPVHFGRPATVPANEPTLAPVMLPGFSRRPATVLANEPALAPLMLPGFSRRHICRGGHQITAYALK